jgi:tRNA-Thr(GGU) m(6)t(6)A37 methyltransferase TsaA
MGWWRVFPRLSVVLAKPVSKINGSFSVKAIGHIEPPLTNRASAPKQGREGFPLAWLVFDKPMREALSDLHFGEKVIVLTWLDRAHRDVLKVHPHGDQTRPQQGVFSTRSPDRPNPIGLHRVKIISIQNVRRIQVKDLEAFMTPILDVKPVLEEEADY